MGIYSKAERKGKTMVRTLVGFAIGVLCLGVVKGVEAEQALLFVGTYTGGPSRGISSFRFDTDTGQIQPLGLAAEIENPSFLVMHPHLPVLYSVSEIGQYQGEESGAVASFAVDETTGTLEPMGSVASRGAHPCHLAVDDSGHWLFVANYTGGNVAVLPLDERGVLGPASCVVQHEGSSVNPERQEAAHAHAVTLSPDERFVVVADLGLDQLVVYRLDKQHGRLTPNDPPFVRARPGAGPRHLTFSPDGRFTWVINELNSTITTYAWQQRKGVLEARQSVSTLPEGWQGVNTTAEVVVSTDGTVLYGSNRGHDSIAVFTIDEASGSLTPVGRTPTRGLNPRHFCLAPGGGFLLAANQGSHAVVVFRREQGGTRLVPTGSAVSVDSPVCVCFFRS